VDGSDFVSTIVTSVVESKLCYTTRGRLRDELNTLNNAFDDFVLDTGVLSFRVLTDGDDVDVVVERLESFDGLARTNVSVQIELPYLK